MKDLKPKPGQTWTRKEPSGFDDVRIVFRVLTFEESNKPENYIVEFWIGVHGNEPHGHELKVQWEKWAAEANRGS